MRSFALAVAALLLIGSCTDNPDPIEPTRTKALPTVTAPVMPEAATAKSPKGQIAFVRHVVSVFNFAVGSGSTQELEGLFDPACEACRRYVARVHSDNAGEGDVEGFKWRVTKGQVLEGDLVEVSIEAAPYRKKVPANGEPAQVEAARYRLGFKLENRNSQWLVTELYIPDRAK
jgi:hypothetical protein